VTRITSLWHGQSHGGISWERVVSVAKSVLKDVEASANGWGGRFAVCVVLVLTCVWGVGWEWGVDGKQCRCGLFDAVRDLVGTFFPDKNVLGRGGGGGGEAREAMHTRIFAGFSVLRRFFLRASKGSEKMVTRSLKGSGGWYGSECGNHCLSCRSGGWRYVVRR
jgi:hypothetical protein